MGKLNSPSYSALDQSALPSCPLWCISLATSIAAAGFAGGALGHSVFSARDFEECLQITLESTSASLASLQHQLTSLAQVALQNSRALDLLTAKKGGTCFFLWEECCYYVNESGIVEQNVKRLTDLAEDLLRRPSKNTLTDLLSSPLVIWLLPFLDPLLVLITLCTLLPCLLQFLRSQVNKISNQTQPASPSGISPPHSSAGGHPR
jgi:hypothetical protein